MLVIAADADPLFRRFIAESLAGTEFETKLAERGEEAWDCAKTAPPPFVMLYGWGLPDVGGAELCKRLRRMESARERYSIATLGPHEERSLASTLEAGVDDVLLKPITAPRLLSRLRLAVRRCSSPARLVGTLRDALHEGLASPHGGEVVVRQGTRVGHVFVNNGGIVWANVSGEPLRLGGVVKSAGVVLDEQDAAAVIDECRREKMHFADVLVRWGYLDQAGARECVRRLVAEQLGLLLAMQDATALFLPGSRAYDGKVSFPLEQVAPPSNAPPADPAIVRDAVIELPKDRRARNAEWAADAIKLDGATAAALLDRHTSMQWAQSGGDIDGTLAWSLLETLSALGAGAEDVVAVRNGMGFLGRVVDQWTVLVVGFDLGKTTLGLARSSMATLVDRRRGRREAAAAEAAERGEGKG